VPNIPKSLQSGYSAGDGKENVMEPKKGVYRHFKGNEYELLHIANDSETLEKLVVYQARYGEKEVWVRPLSMWDEVVEYEGKKVTRFTFLHA